MLPSGLSDSTMTDVHVALITPWERQGGIATYSNRLVEALEEIGIEVTPVPICNTDSSNPVGFVNIVSRIPDESDVVHVQFEAGLFGKLGMSGIGAPAFFLALNRSDYLVVTTLHEVHSKHSHKDTLGDYLLRTRDFVIERLALRASDATVVHTQEARRILQDRHGNSYRIERMLHPADGEAEPLPREVAKNQLGMDGLMLLTFGFVEEKKRYQDVIQVLPELPDVTYVIAGGFREGEGDAIVDECQELAAELGVEERVRFTGYVDDEDVPVMFSAADAVVLPYERVSQSGVVNEALGYRQLIIATSLPAFEELCSEYNCLLTYQNRPELISQIKTLLFDSKTASELGKNVEEYLDDISWSNFSEQTMQLYKNVATRHMVQLE